MHILLPLYVSAAEDELPGFIAVLVALADHTHEAGRLNAKRHARLVARVHELAEGFVQAMTSPGRVTWPRLYSNLLRADGVDAVDARAVGGWVAAFAARSYAEQVAARGFALPLGDGPLGEAAYVEALCAERSRQARRLLAGRFGEVALAEQVQPQPCESPLIGDAPDDEPEGDRYGEQAGILADRWTAAGLDALLHGPYAHLAPGGSAPAPLLALVHGLLRLEVSDAGAGRPEVRSPGADVEHGRGLQVLDALSHRWGVSDRAGGIGKTVWSELKAPDLVPAPSNEADRDNRRPPRPAHPRLGHLARGPQRANGPLRHRRPVGSCAVSPGSVGGTNCASVRRPSMASWNQRPSL
ncbi:ATP-binding protein [Streptomyces kutzneri]|uniref:ATP-binding protein n=1 Tax=Streptomyces kutzneri TaxID=3051179 RepID=UPI0028D51459|nr:ATP-binding protein [Streptomyces sp. DSM 40907]